MKAGSLRNGICALVCFCCMVHVSAQRVPAALENAAKEFFVSYNVPSYRPHDKMRMTDCKLNDAERQLHVYANEAFAAQPFTPERVASIYADFKQSLPSPYDSYTIKIYGNKKEISELIPNLLNERTDKRKLWPKHYDGNPWVRNVSRPVVFTNGLDNRHIALWASHGRFYKQKTGKWEWQRPRLFGTCEDLFTQSVVIPFLMPMLENAGAILYSPRERDWQTCEVIVDNDAPTSGGQYLETNHSHGWETTPLPGFSHNTGTLSDNENPFTKGTARFIATTKRKSKVSSCSWIPNIPESGSYAVYVSYQSFPGSIDDAHYTVYHKGGSTEFRVNQQMGGNTWVYLGTFEFSKGTGAQNRVVLTNESRTSGVVAADAVRFGGGMGNIVRGESTSTYPRFMEGARYYTQWAGFPYEVYSTKNGEDDYGDDINTRSLSANLLGGGSCYMPGEEGRNVPIELTLAVHSDAGYTPDRSIYGTLGICTTERENLYTHYSAGISRTTSFDFASTLLQTLSTDLSAFTGRPWIRRELFDRNYSETRLPETPSAIIETLSHQNFEDLRYGHDPNFKFALARAIYKSILRFVSFQHQAEYVVQPLPVERICAHFTEGQEIEIRWAPATDTLEETARPTGYIVYTKENDGDFDNGVQVKNNAFRKTVAANTLYSFKVTAINSGGESFPSEIITAYKALPSLHTALIVNGFDRLSGPAFIDTPDSLGFDLKADWGVPYLGTTGYCGYQYCFDRSLGDGQEPDMWGFSGEELVGKYIPGNSFNYPYIHGKAMTRTPGLSFVSSSRAAFERGDVNLSGYKVIDLILGLEKDCPHNLKKYKTFTPIMQKRLTDFCQQGGNIFVSGAYIASDMQQSHTERDFVQNVLKYAFERVMTDSTPHVRGLNRQIPLITTPEGRQYPLRSSDCIAPVAPAFAAFSNDNGECMGTAFKGNKYKTLCLSFPFECIAGEQVQADVMSSILHFLTR